MTPEAIPPTPAQPENLGPVASHMEVVRFDPAMAMAAGEAAIQSYLRGKAENTGQAKPESPDIYLYRTGSEVTAEYYDAEIVDAELVGHKPPNRGEGSIKKPSEGEPTKRRKRDYTPEEILQIQIDYALRQEAKKGRQKQEEQKRRTEEAERETEKREKALQEAHELAIQEDERWEAERQARELEAARRAQEQAEQEELERRREIEEQEERNPVLGRIREKQFLAGQIKALAKINAEKRRKGEKPVNGRVELPDENFLNPLWFVDNLASPNAQKDYDKIVLTTEGFELIAQGLGKEGPPSKKMLEGIRRIIKNQGLKKLDNINGHAQYVTKHGEVLGPFDAKGADLVAIIEKKLDPKTWLLRDEDRIFYQRLMKLSPDHALPMKSPEETVKFRKRYSIIHRPRHNRFVKAILGKPIMVTEAAPTPESEQLALSEEILARAQGRRGLKSEIDWSTKINTRALVKAEQEHAEPLLKRDNELRRYIDELGDDRLVA